MTISAGDRKLLWARSGGFCAECKTSLTQGASEIDPPAVLGEEAHIVSAKPTGPRYRPLPEREVDAYENRILLCPSDHKRVDRQLGTYTEDRLRALKKDHESWASRRGLDRTPIRLRDLNPGKPLRLYRMETGQRLMSLLDGAYSSRTQTPALASRAEADLIGDFLHSVQDWFLIWDDLDPGEQLKIEFEIGEQLNQLHEAGFVLYVGLTEKILEGGIGDPVLWREASLHIYRTTDALVAA